MHVGGSVSICCVALFVQRLVSTICTFITHFNLEYSASKLEYWRPIGQRLRLATHHPTPPLQHLLPHILSARTRTNLAINIEAARAQSRLNVVGSVG